MKTIKHVFSVAVTSLAISGAALCMLRLNDSTAVAQQPQRQPFGNSVAQRNEMIQQLQDIKDLLKQQNAILQTLKQPGKPSSGKR